MFEEGKFDLSKLRKENIFKKKAKWHVVLKVLKPKNMKRYFEASSTIKWDEEKGNENVRSDWKKCF